MPLYSTGQTSKREGNVFVFPMYDDGPMIIMVKVASAALSACEPMANDTDSDIFSRHRKLFEAHASKKFDGGILEPDGTVMITTADIVEGNIAL